LDIGYVGIGQISAKIPGYRAKYQEIWLKYTLLRKLKILVALADIWLKIYNISFGKNINLEDISVLVSAGPFLVDLNL
jgi:hypothetical protein